MYWKECHMKHNAIPLLEVTNLSVSLAGVEQENRTLVDHISFTLAQGEILSLVGESGSGKTLTARAIMQLFSSPSLFISSGSITWKGKNLLTFSDAMIQDLRGKNIAYIPQAPMSALNPMMTVGEQLIESYKKGPSSEAYKTALDLVHQCGFIAPVTIMNSYPHELSGGMRQRISIAMALMNNPECIIADEPTTALDVSIQAEVLDLLVKLVREHRTALLFITHDLGVVARISDRVMIMRQGKVIEDQGVYALFEHPKQEYTRLLIESSTV